MGTEKTILITHSPAFKEAAKNVQSVPIGSGYSVISGGRNSVITSGNSNMGSGYRTISKEEQEEREKSKKLHEEWLEKEKRKIFKFKDWKIKKENGLLISCATNGVNSQPTIVNADTAKYYSD